MSTFIVKVLTATNTNTYFAIAATTADAIMDATDIHSDVECVIAAHPRKGGQA